MRKMRVDTMKMLNSVVVTRPRPPGRQNQEVNPWQRASLMLRHRPCYRLLSC